MTEFHLIYDVRTKKYFGGGRADGLFSHWVADIKGAKRFFRAEMTVHRLQEMNLRMNQHPFTEQNADILGAIPHFAVDAYEIQRYEDGVFKSSESVFDLLEKVAETKPSNPSKQ